MQRAYDDNGARSPWETGGDWEGLTPAELQAMNWTHNYWSFVDPRDANLGMERALTAQHDGSYPVFIVDRHNVIGEESRVLAELFYPGVAVKGDLFETESLINWHTAESLIGFQSRHSMKPHYDLFAG